VRLNFARSRERRRRWSSPRQDPSAHAHLVRLCTKTRGPASRLYTDIPRSSPYPLCRGSNDNARPKERSRKEIEKCRRRLEKPSSRKTVARPAKKETALSSQTFLSPRPQQLRPCPRSTRPSPTARARPYWPSTRRSRATTRPSCATFSPRRRFRRRRQCPRRAAAAAAAGPLQPPPPGCARLTPWTGTSSRSWPTRRGLVSAPRSQGSGQRARSVFLPACRRRCRRPQANS